MAWENEVVDQEYNGDLKLFELELELEGLLL
jgi:hypothetical protein